MVRWAGASLALLLLAFFTAEPAHARASAGARHVTLDYCQPIGPETVLCEKVDLLVNLVNTPAGVFMQFDHVDGVVDIYHQGTWASASLRSYRLHLLTEDGVQKLHSLQSSFEIVTADGTVFCGVIHNHYANGALQLDRIEPC